MAIFMTAAGGSTYLTVHLLIHGKNSVVVPDLEGREIVYALEMLTDLGLNIKVPGSEFNAAIPKNHVISQDPSAGSEIKPGRDVRLVISKGARSVIVPNLVGISLPRARILLDENGLIENKLSFMHDPAYPQNDIIAQYPPTGDHRIRGDRVNLLVSAGPAPTRIPMANLVGITLNQAILAVEQYQLTVAAIHYIDDEQLPDDTVKSHKPQAGYPLTTGTGVELSVNRNNRDALSGARSGVDLFRYRVSSGYLRRSIQVNINRPASEVELFNAYVKPGEEIWLLIPYTDTSTLLLYVDDELIKTKHYNRLE